MPDIKTDVLPWLPHGLFDNQNSHRKSKGEFMNVGNIFLMSQCMHVGVVVVEEKLIK